MLTKIRFLAVVGPLAAICVLIVLQPAWPGEETAGDAPAAAKVSTFAPAGDLAQQADRYVKELETSVANQQDYQDSVDKLARDSHTLAVIALNLGLNDQENKYKSSAGALMKAAQAVAAAKDFAAAQKAVAAVKDAAEGNGPAGAELKWEKVAALPELMKQVPLVNTKLKRSIKPSKFKSKAKDTAGYSAVIAAIAQGTIADTSEAKNPEQVKQWRKFMTAMRDHAGHVNAAIHRGDEPAAAASMKKLNQSCEDCHTVFHPEVKLD